MCRSFFLSTNISPILTAPSVHGTVPTVNRICDDPAIKAISFVGSDKAGEHIYNR